MNIRKSLIFIITFVGLLVSLQAQPGKNINPYVALQLNVGTTLGQMRSAPININGQRYLLLIYSEDRDYRIWLSQNIGGGYGSVYEYVLKNIGE